MSRFHYAFKVRDLDATRNFYCKILECREGRSTDTWLDFEFYGHQMSAHRSDDVPSLDYCGQVDGIAVPIPHFGCLVDRAQFDRVVHRLEEHGVDLLIKPQVRYAGLPGEQWTVFFLDPSGNPIEIKHFTNEEEVF